jgi:hypothetical protein
MDEWRF